MFPSIRRGREGERGGEREREGERETIQRMISNNTKDNSHWPHTYTNTDNGHAVTQLLQELLIQYRQICNIPLPNNPPLPIIQC